MLWNLVEHLSAAVFPRRAFYLPLASIPPGRDTIRSVPMDVFTPADDTTASPDKVFNIRISPPPGGFSNEETLLPDPAYRLHAMVDGSIRFKPADGTMKDRLILGMTRFMMLGDPPWWRQWCDIDCVPDHLIYENVDQAELVARLNSFKPGESLYGLTFPPQVADVTQRAQFITNFLKGDDNTYLNAEAGAVIGTAASDPANRDRLLKLRGRYIGHTAGAPQFMNPREFFYLLFGDDSDEAKKHPLLQKMDEVGKATTTGLETRSMRLRPPLRTHKRVIWESDFEKNKHSVDWARYHKCKNRLYNTHQREDRSFEVDGYDSSPKCNLFVSDIALRSGFRVCIWVAGPSYWHYLSAGVYASEADNAGNSTSLVPLNGVVEGEGKTWGFKIEPLLRSLDDDDFMLAYLQGAIDNEGRCFILAGSRGENVGFIGHIMIVEKVNGPPKLVDNSKAGHGLKSIAVTLREASSSDGASSGDDTCKLGTGGREYYHRNFTRLHLIELHPGKDPDTDTGLRDCNVRII